MSESGKPSHAGRSSREVLTQDLRGRPYRYDAAASVKYVALLKAGSFHTPAAYTAGLDPKAVNRWRRRGESLWRAGEFPVWHGGILPPSRVGLERFCRVLACIADGRQDPDLWLAGFAAACTEAEGESEASLVLVVRKATAERPDLAVKLLERRYPERWGAKPPGPAVQVNASQVAALTIYAPPEEDP